MKSITCLLGFMMLLASCSSNHSNWESAKLMIDFGQSNDASPSEVLSTSFVKLETGDGCLIGTVSQAEEYKGIFYLLDAFITKTVYAFDGQGNFVSTVGRVGNGPGEYVVPSSFFISDALQTEQKKTLKMDNICKILFVIISLTIKASLFCKYSIFCRKMSSLFDQKHFCAPELTIFYELRNETHQTI